MGFHLASRRGSRRPRSLPLIHGWPVVFESCEEKQPLLMPERPFTLASEVSAGVFAGGVERHPSHQRPRTRACAKHGN